MIELSCQIGSGRAQIGLLLRAILLRDMEGAFLMNRIILALMASSLVFSAGCASKKYVRNEVTPIVNKTNELDDLTAKNSRDIKDVDARAQQGIQQVTQKTTEVEQKTQAAAQQASQAQELADK